MKNSEITMIKIYNTKGLLMKTTRGIENLDTSELKSGFYVIEFLLKNCKIKRQFLEIGNLSKIK